MEKVNVYELTEEQLLDVIKRAFKHGWSMRMNRKAGELENVLEDFVTVISIDLSSFLVLRSQSASGGSG